MIPVILAGGAGTRLWPLSRTAFPKQFLSLGHEETLLQQAISRLDGLVTSGPIVITNEDHRFLVAEQLRTINSSASIILEPVSRNTAPAIAIAALEVLEQSEDESPVMLVLAADHVIKDISTFHQAVNELLPHVQEGKFGTLGIVPTEPATGYGYIRAERDSSSVYKVEQFVEKPDAKTAQAYLDEGSYFWNSGLFLVRADRYLDELKRYQPDMYHSCKRAMENRQKDHDFIRIDVDAFKSCPDDSIDYAIMEPLAGADSKGDVVVVPMDAGWSDVGSWSALWDIAEKNESGNATLHAGQEEQPTILKNTTGSLICTSDRMVTTVGVTDLVIVDTKDALLVAHRDEVQDVKAVVSQLAELGYPQYQYHREVYRHWGHYDSIDSGERYQVKRITVKPGAKLSLQMHHHRAEHWVVVSGTAKVTKGDNTFLVTENESTFIPVGCVHSLENPGKLPLEMIEVQSGSYLGEDDIIRIKDLYGRV